MDSIIHHSIAKEVWQTFPPMLWFILYLGWFAYWGKKLNEINQSNKEKPISIRLGMFWNENWVEVPFSALACVVLALITDLPPSVSGSKFIMGSVFSLGYSSSSVLNFMVTSALRKNGKLSLKPDSQTNQENATD